MKKPSQESKPNSDSDCKHHGLHFSAGGYYIHCKDCPRRWAAVQPKFDIFDIEARLGLLGELDERRNPMEVKKAEPYYFLDCDSCGRAFQSYDKGQIDCGECLK